MEFLLILLIPLGFIGVFLAAPFWISRVTKAEHEEVLTEAQNYEGKGRDEFIEAQRKDKRLGEYSKSLSGGSVAISRFMPRLITRKAMLGPQTLNKNCFLVLH